MDPNPAVVDFARVAVDGRVTWAVVENQRVYEITGVPYTRWERAGEIGVVGEFSLLAPATPSKIVCVGRNYEAHAAESGNVVPAEPILFLKPPSSLIGPGAPIILPAGVGRVDHEAELTLMIGRRCRHVTPQEAWTYVLGITCGNDVSARDIQRQDGQWMRGKGFDTFCPLGPWIRAGLQEPEVADLPISCRVNGAVRQSARTSEMTVSPAHLIAFISGVMTLEPGDLVMTGTPAGISRLYGGDIVEVEIEGLGILRNPVKG